MTASLLFASDVPGWTVLSMPLIALLSAGAGLLAGKFLFGKQGVKADAAPAWLPPLSRPDLGPPSDPELAEKYWEERRSSPRHKVRQVKVIVADPLDEVDPVEGWLLNRSLGGLGLSVPSAVPSGRVMQVRTTGESDISPWVKVEIRYCRLERGRWTLGCKFVEPLPSNSLLFG